MFNKKKSIIFFICFILLGVIISIQFRSTLLTNKQKILVSQEVTKLKDQLTAQQSKYKELQNKNDRLELKKNDVIGKSRNKLNEERINMLIKEREQLRIIGGLTDVKGQGIIITLNDGLRTSEFEDISKIIVHDKYLLKIVNELHKAGAQAVSINNERITAATKILCAGPAIKVNNNRCAVPYIIHAIGAPDKLYNDIFNSSIIKELLLYKIRVDIKKSKDLVINKYVLFSKENSFLLKERVVNNEINR